MIMAKIVNNSLTCDGLKDLNRFSGYLLWRWHMACREPCCPPALWRRWWTAGGWRAWWTPPRSRWRCAPPGPASSAARWWRGCRCRCWGLPIGNIFQVCQSSVYLRPRPEWGQSWCDFHYLAAACQHQTSETRGSLLNITVSQSHSTEYRVQSTFHFLIEDKNESKFNERQTWHCQ